MGVRVVVRVEVGHGAVLRDDAAQGGAEVRPETLAENFRLLASADASLAQIPQSHFVYVNVIGRQGSPEQREFFLGEVLAGRRFGTTSCATRSARRHLSSTGTPARSRPKRGVHRVRRTRSRMRAAAGAMSLLRRRHYPDPASD